jgi:hypothetical protein
MARSLWGDRAAVEADARSARVAMLQAGAGSAGDLRIKNTFSRATTHRTARVRR